MIFGVTWHYSRYFSRDRGVALLGRQFSSIRRMPGSIKATFWNPLVKVWLFILSFQVWLTVLEVDRFIRSVGCHRLLSWLQWGVVQVRVGRVGVCQRLLVGGKIRFLIVVIGPMFRRWGGTSNCYLYCIALEVQYFHGLAFRGIRGSRT